MRASLFLFLVVATIAVSLAVATNGDNPSRQLKGVQTSSVEEEPLSAHDEERGWHQQALEKVKAQKALQNVEKVAETATTGKSKWQSGLEKLKANNFKNIDDINVPVADQNRWQAAVATIQAGKLSNLDTTNNKWQNAFNKLKASGQLKNVDEAQVAKFTEGVAKEIAKNPEKSGKFGKIMQFVFGATLTGLIVYDINTMVTTSMAKFFEASVYNKTYLLTCSR
ncbi:hypothetical protein PI125_g20842 [Phytophthora idaei]|nr:hypothetical protein PI125_g20842 [Phytophthora idaei]KAG3133430.1 hypothetical protein PI126_g19188 [Phytophthora idaei]